MSDGTLTERERLVYSAKLAEQAERYDGAFSVRRRAFARARGLLNSTRCQPSLDRGRRIRALARPHARPPGGPRARSRRRGAARSNPRRRRGAERRVASRREVPRARSKRRKLAMRRREAAFPRNDRDRRLRALVHARDSSDPLLALVPRTLNRDGRVHEGPVQARRRGALGASRRDDRSTDPPK